MNLPSRGLRLSATTMRYTGVFRVPTLFNRIRTAIRICSAFGSRNCRVAEGNRCYPRKIGGEPSQGYRHWQALFWPVFAAGANGFELQCRAPRLAQYPSNLRGISPFG